MHCIDITLDIACILLRYTWLWLCL